MKKRSFKALALNKKAISNFDHAVKGGDTQNTNTCGVSCPWGECVESVTYCTHNTCGTCIVTHCADGIICNLTGTKGKY
ncbi:MAG: hypothetical protein AAF611_11890 [Bacteroidota bacterium]